MEIVCPICLSKKCGLVEQWRNYSMYLCQTCDVVFANPMRAGSDYYENHAGYLLKDGLLIDQLRWDYRWDIMQFLKTSPNPRGTLLDIGCGTGFFVKKAVDMGFNGYGIELSARSIHIGRAHFKLSTLYPLSLEDFVSQNPSLLFNVVTLFQVLEHLEDPNRLIELVKAILHEDALVVISLPYRQRWPDPSGKESDSPPHHLTRWSMKAMNSFLDSHGFYIKSHRVENFPLSNISGLVYNYLLKFIPSVTMEGQGLYKEIDAISEEQAQRIMKKRKLKVKAVNFLGIPLWLMYKLLGAKGPSLYIEAKLK